MNPLIEPYFSAALPSLHRVYALVECVSQSEKSEHRTKLAFWLKVNLAIRSWILLLEPSHRKLIYFGY